MFVSKSRTMKWQVSYHGNQLIITTHLDGQFSQDKVQNGLFCRFNKADYYWERFSGYFNHEIAHCYLRQLVSLRDPQTKASNLTQMQEALVSPLSRVVWESANKLYFLNSVNLESQQMITTLLLGYNQIFRRLLPRRTTQQIKHDSNQLLNTLGKQVFENPRTEFSIQINCVPQLSIPKRFKFDRREFEQDAKFYLAYLRDLNYPHLGAMQAIFDNAWADFSSDEFYSDLLEYQLFQ